MLLTSAAQSRPRLRSRSRDLAERRLSLVKLLIALFVARMVVTRVGPVVIYGLTAVFVVAAVVLLVLGNPHDTLLDVAIVCREITTIVFLGVILAAYMSVRQVSR